MACINYPLIHKDVTLLHPRPLAGVKQIHLSLKMLQVSVMLVSSVLLVVLLLLLFHLLSFVTTVYYLEIINE